MSRLYARLVLPYVPNVPNDVPERLDVIEYCKSVPVAVSLSPTSCSSSSSKTRASALLGVSVTKRFWSSNDSSTERDLDPEIPGLAKSFVGLK